MTPLRYAAVLAAVCALSCSTTDSAPAGESIGPDASCEGNFGEPNARSGLDATSCSTTCACAPGERAWTLPNTAHAAFAYTHENPQTPLTEDPYLAAPPSPAAAPEACVITLDDAEGSYRLDTVALAEADPAAVTHLGPCGACSALVDLAVYTDNTDLTDPVRDCGLRGIDEGMQSNVECLEGLGFSHPCAIVWFYNTANTRDQCLVPCFANLESPYLTAEGALNECLACDEEKSGPIFKHFSGRTRRNSGLPSAICRPCSTVARVSHAYLR